MPGRERERRDYLRRIPLAIANSHAAARVLQSAVGLRRRHARVPQRAAPEPRARGAGREALPDGPIKLGVAARLYPVKGIALVLHAVQRRCARRPSTSSCRSPARAPSSRGSQRSRSTLGIAGRVTFPWRRPRHGGVLPEHRLSRAPAAHRSVRPRRDRSGGARLPRGRRRCRRPCRRPSPTASAVAPCRRRCRSRATPALGGGSTAPAAARLRPCARCARRAVAVDPDRVAAAVARVFADAAASSAERGGERARARAARFRPRTFAT